jgi:hypothetical protein
LSLADISAIAGIVSGGAVTITLVFIALQVRQAERNQRAIMQQGRASRVSLTTLGLAEHPELARLWTKAMYHPENITNDEFDVAYLVARVAFLSSEDSYLQHKAGLLDDVAFRSFEAGLRNIFGAAPGMRALWRFSSVQFGADFARYINDILSETPPKAAPDRFAHFKALTREELARSAPTAPAE